jgi:uncharacterized protein YcaQ
VLALQIDPINVLVRSQYLPVFSRLGSYPRPALDSIAYERHELFEYYAHQASLVPTSLYPLFRWRMDAHAANLDRRRDLPDGFVDRVLAQVAERGPIAASELYDRGRRGKYGKAWSWNDGKRVLASLLLAGRVAVARRRGIEQLYDLTERVIPRASLDVPAPDPDAAKRELLLRATRAMGIATARDLEDYLSVGRFLDRRADPNITRVRALLHEVVDDGRLVAVRVEGWRDVAYMEPKTRIPSRVDARALLSPFDSLIWERDRTRRLFGFDYRVEIYIPGPQRVHGYYVLPFLVGDRLLARVDLKADRSERSLVVQAAHVEPGAELQMVAAELADELDTMAEWLELEQLTVRDRGNLARALRKAAM